MKTVIMTDNINSGLTVIDNYFKTAFSVDCVIFGFDGKDLKVLLVKSATDEFVGYWSLIGDLIFPEEDLDSAAYRILHQRTGLSNADLYLEQVHAFGQVNRHPLGRVVTVAYYSLININNYKQSAASFESEAKWENVKEVGQLAFDHNKILVACLEGLKKRLATHPIGFNLLPEKFTLTELQTLYEAILDRELDKRNFRKKILSMKILKDLNERQTKVAHRPPKLYSFNPGHNVSKWT